MMRLDMDPYLAEDTWSGEVELDLGDLGFCLATAEIKYSKVGTTWYMGSYYSIVATINDKQVDVTNLISEFALEDIFEQYIVNG